MDFFETLKVAPNSALDDAFDSELPEPIALSEVINPVPNAQTTSVRCKAITF
jgi:hypothetical protein